MSLEDTMRSMIREELRHVLQEELPAMLAQVRPPGDVGEYLSVEKAAAIADVHQDTVRGWVKSGRLPEHRAGRELRVRRDQLRRFLEGNHGEKDRPTAEEEAVTILARKRSG